MVIEKLLRVGAMVAAVSISLAAISYAGATSVSTDSWGCPWTGSTVIQSFEGTANTSAAVECSSSAGVQMTWEDTNYNWHIDQWEWEFSTVTDSELDGVYFESQHQIYVSGHGYGQIEDTYAGSEV